ncbi:hypothetical protein PR048_029504 [Dryococelus australis]|uniref:Uncharacterized protein n=1 Tax=Dryococelus australis TaxID=614101 RepID=A0ABQ9GE85_9NEOP|nr:hypothetical protein PR048_029504 [Dryococelus australis]
MKKESTNKLKFSTISDSDESDMMDIDYSDADNDFVDFEELTEVSVRPSVGDFVLVKFSGKETVTHFAGLISTELLYSYAKKTLDILAIQKKKIDQLYPKVT